MTSEVAAPAPETTAANGHGDAHTTASFGALTLGSIGVVYGDIGTSPLYALRQAVVAASAGGQATSQGVLGVLSLILWALIIVVTLKYVVILLRADNHGEGGTLALMALAQRGVTKAAGTIVLLGIISGALFYGDAVITPALSVLSAIEGIELVTESLDPYVVPITILILVALFAVQSRGTARVAAFFGPIMLVWFLVIGLAALPAIARQPEVLLSLNPLHAVSFMLHHGVIGFVTLGAVFLAVTGAELSRPGRARDRRSESYRKSLLPDVSRMVAVADGWPCDGSNRHRKPGGDHRCLLADASGDPAGPDAALRDPPHLGSAIGPDLHPAHQPHVADRGDAAGLHVQIFQRAGLRLRHSRHGNHGGHGDDGLCRDLEGLEMVAVCGCGADGAVPVSRSDLPCGQPSEGVGGRLGAARARCLGDAADVHVAARQPALVRQVAEARIPARRSCCDAGETPAATGSRHGRFPDQRSRQRTHGTDAQPEALQGPAREERHPDRRIRLDAARRPHRAGQAGTAQPDLPQSDVEIRFHGIAQCAEGACDCAKARLAFRHHVDLVLSVTARAETCRPFRHAALAGSSLHRPQPDRQ